MTDNLIEQYADLIRTLNTYGRTRSQVPAAFSHRLSVLVNELDQRYGEDGWLEQAVKAVVAVSTERL